MNLPLRRCLPLAAVAAALVITAQATAGPIYVTSANGTSANIYQYDDIADLAAQTPTNITGTLVGTVAGWHNDQGVTYDYSTGYVYRIANGGNVFQFDSVEDWIAGGPSTQVSSGGPFSNGNQNRVNDVSYDGATGGFYAVGASSGSDTAGDILVYDNVASLQTASHDSTYGDNTYGANRVVFWSREGYSGTTVLGEDVVNARYYQIAGNGRLEAFKSLAAYSASAGNRIHLGNEGAFGGGANETGFQAIAAFSTPVPEPSSLALFVIGFGLLLRRWR